MLMVVYDNRISKVCNIILLGPAQFSLVPFRNFKLLTKASSILLYDFGGFAQFYVNRRAILKRPFKRDWSGLFYIICNRGSALGQAKFLRILESNSTIEVDPKHDCIPIFGSLGHDFTTTQKLQSKPI